MAAMAAQGWLDDMPSAGWGFGALGHNRTDDFLALLYGHMATYQARGSFHATEQLAFTGDSLYRDFLHWPNPAAAAARAGGDARPVSYYANENDVSLCVVTEVLVARLTRWQLVLEDTYRLDSGGPAVWLARGAPRRWFVPAANVSLEPWGVTNAATAFGLVAFTVTPVPAQNQVP